MPRFSYTAVDTDNKKINSVLEARDEDDLRQRLRAMNLFPLKYKELEKGRVPYRLKPGECAEFSRQLAGMLGSGITAVRAMEILKDSGLKPRLARVYERLHRDVLQGYTMSEAMRLQGRAFPELLVNMYASGEAGGQLEGVAFKMGTHYEKEHRLNGKIKTAMTYPTILFCVTVAVVLVIFLFILPQFFTLFENVELPAITKVVVAISGFLRTRWYMALVGAAVTAGASAYLLALPPVKLAADRLKLHTIKVSGLLKIIYTARFARTLASLYTSGVSMLTALEIASTITGNKYIESQFAKVVTKVRNGDPLSEAVGAVDGFDRKLATSILIGEESGRLDAMLESVADSFDYEAEMATGRLVQLVEPIMLIVMAVIIGGIMLAVMLPIFTLYQNAGSM